MIRPFTCVCMLLAGGAGLYLYSAKHNAQLLDREIARTVKQAEAARERAGVLRAEYTQLNDPQRLAELATSHLPALKSTAPTQFTTWAEFEKRLPPVGAPAADPPPLEAEAPTAKLPEPKPEPRPEPKAEPKSEPKAEPARPIAARPAPAPHQVAAQSPPHMTPTPVSLSAALLAPAAPRPRPQVASASQTAAHPATAPGAPASARPVTVSALSFRPPPPRTVPTYTPPAYTASASSTAEVVARIARGAPVDPSVPAVASALGMARSMMAPPQITPASAATIWQPGGGGQR